MVVGDIATGTDVLVVGGGPGGYVAAVRAAQMGLDVTLVEARDLGGVCLREGCIPSKALISAADTYWRAGQLGRLGLPWTAGAVDVSLLRGWKDAVIRQLTDGVGRLCQARGVRVIRGRASLQGPDTAVVDQENGREVFRFRHGILASGARARTLPELPADGERIVLPEQLLDLRALPSRLIVVGGGYIGVELGTALAKLGTPVTILESCERLLPTVDAELARVVAQHLNDLGVEVRTSVRVQGAEVTADAVAVRLAGEARPLPASHVLVSVGREANVQDLGLDRAGLRLEGPFLAVDEQQRTAVAGLYAIGDLTGEPMLAHRASHQGIVAAEAAAGRPAAFDPTGIPAVVFSDPEVASVGLGEEEARGQGYAVRVGRFPLRALGRALAEREADGFAKVIADAESGVVLGAGVVGAHASDVIGEMALALEMGATLEDVAATIHPHPTFSEMWGEAALAATGAPLHIVR